MENQNAELMNYITTRLLFLTSFMIAANVSFAQMERIDETIHRSEAESHLRFLTADELRGRNTGTTELLVAGRYIAEQFRRYGLLPLGDGPDDYLQKVALHSARPATVAEASMLGKDFRNGVDLAILAGDNGTIEAPWVYLADLQDYKTVDLEGKVVVTMLRSLQASATDRNLPALLQEAGAVALVQFFGPGLRVPWQLVLNYFSQERMSLGEIEKGEKQSLPHIWLRDTTELMVQQLKDNSGASVSITIEGTQKKSVEAYNIVGKIEGTDPELKKEHLVMCAHYDHVGVQSGQGQDSIFNGTRDNGIGTTGLINAAQYFGKYPPKRSVIIIALTGEEKGLLGSQYYVENPKVPLEETVFAFNIDNSGYTGTEVVTLLDTNRTNIDELVYQAASEVGLGVIGDRIPDQNYYERSDQVSFANKGVPAVNFKMAMAAFDERISEYYHRPSDEFHTVDIDYIHKYWKAYIRAAELIGNWSERPYWIEGDKFEPAGKALYKMD